MLDAQVRRGVHVRAALPRAGVAVAWLGIFAAVVVSLTQAGVPVGEVVAYLAAWLVGCTFPGVMIWRALSGPTTIVRELGFGSVLGIVLQLAVWALGTSVHHPLLLMWALPAGVVVAFIAVPDLRRHWWPRRLPAMRTLARWHIAMAVAITLSIWRFYSLTMVRRALPPEPSLVARDTWYNSAISYELTRTIRPQDPFVVGEDLRYHWFADAHVTATAQLSETPIVNAMITSWLVPILVILLLAVAAAAEHFMAGPRLVGRGGAVLSDLRRWWVGPAAAFFTLAAAPYWRFGHPPTQRITDGFVSSSPSGILAGILIVALAGPILDLLRGRARRGTWVVLTLLLAASVGTKPSILPVVVCGAALVILVDLVRRRRVNWPMVYVVGVSGLFVGAASSLLTGSTGGSHFQLLALMTIDSSYVQLLNGAPVVPAAGGWLVPALADHVPHAVPIIATLLLVWLLTETPRMMGLLAVFARPFRSDRGFIWAWGLLVGGYCGMWMLAHPGYSEHYFWTVGLPLANVLAVTSAVRLVPSTRRARTLLVPMVVLAVPGIVAAWLTTLLPAANIRGTVGVVVFDRLRPYLVMLAGLGVALLLTRLLRIVNKGASLPLLTCVAGFALAATLVAPVQQQLSAKPPRMNPLPRVGVSYPYISTEQQKAAIWLRDHSATTSVVATNSFCWPMGHDRPHCLVNSMWLSGLSGRRTVLSDWTYSQATMAAYDGSVGLNRMSTPWPERKSLSVHAVKAPTRKVLGRLRHDYGARWIFADDRSTPISPKLKKLASLRYQSDHIEIYRLRNSY